ncbi:MAG: aminodeoxychorismate/anthranilate synthase component II [Propionibacteriaceae bacterium]|nr:aminodeoxychorismate/anthranilate synthase component II [Propionibacteriaceae bacterium]
MIVLIDNYDSFSFNLYQQIGTILSDACNKTHCHPGESRDDNAVGDDREPGRDLPSPPVILSAAKDLDDQQAEILRFAQDDRGGAQDDRGGAQDDRGGAQDDNIVVVRNDALTPAQVLALNPTHIVLSPGPGAPRDAGICIDLIKAAAGKVPLFGVCLGHQALCEAFGATVSYAKELVHGKASPCRLDTANALFRGLPATIPVARYHSLAALDYTLPDVLQATAWTEDGEIMAVAHRDLPLYGVQFHPESILTPDGDAIMRNFLSIKAEVSGQAMGSGTVATDRGTSDSHGARHRGRPEDQGT